MPRKPRRAWNEVLEDNRVRIVRALTSYLNNNFDELINPFPEGEADENKTPKNYAKLFSNITLPEDATDEEKEEYALSRAYAHFAYFVYNNLAVNNSSVIKIIAEEGKDDILKNLLIIFSKIPSKYTNISGKRRNFFSSLFSMISDQTCLRDITTTEKMPEVISVINVALETKSFDFVIRMMKSRGMILETDFNNLLIWCGGVKGADGKYVGIDNNLLDYITKMMKSQGMISEDDFNNLLTWCGATKNADGRYVDIDYNLLKYITKIMESQGMISEDDFNNLLTWCCSTKGVDGKYVDIDIHLLNCIAIMMHGKGMILEDDFNKLLTWCCVTKDVNGDFKKNEAGRYAGLNYKLLASISKMMAGKGLILEESFYNLLNWCGVMRDINNEFIQDADGEFLGVDYDLLCYVIDAASRNRKTEISESDFTEFKELYVKSNQANNLTTSTTSSLAKENPASVDKAQVPLNSDDMDFDGDQVYLSLDDELPTKRHNSAQQPATTLIPGQQLSSASLNPDNPPREIDSPFMSETEYPFAGLHSTFPLPEMLADSPPSCDMAINTSSSSSPHENRSFEQQPSTSPSSPLSSSTRATKISSKVGGNEASTC